MPANYIFYIAVCSLCILAIGAFFGMTFALKCLEGEYLKLYSEIRKTRECIKDVFIDKEK